MFFRIVLAIPHLLWAQLWQWAFLLLLPFAWIVALIWGRLDDDLHSFLARYVRYQTHLYAYLMLLANPYPRFRGYVETYPMDVEIDPAARQSRWATFFRLILAVPAYLFSSLLMTVLYVIAFAGWFVALAIGRMPEGMRDLGAYCLRYNTQTYAYLALLTSRYPTLASGRAGTPSPPADAGEPSELPRPRDPE